MFDMVDQIERVFGFKIFDMIVNGIGSLECIDSKWLKNGNRSFFNFMQDMYLMCRVQFGEFFN